MEPIEGLAPADLEAMLKELEGKSQDELFAELLEIKTNQRTAAKKNYKPEVAKRARMKRVAKIKKLVELAKAAGVYEKIMEKANAAASAKIGETAADADVADEETAETEAA